MGEGITDFSFKHYLKENAGVKKIDYAGSSRRLKETIGDIDFLVVSDIPEKVMDSFVKAPGVKRVIRKGRTKAAVLLDEGINDDLRVIEEDSYGSAFQYFKGNKDHNSDDLLKDMDVVLVSVHSGFKSSRKKMTERILRALDNKYVNILAHPTGRMIHKREGYDADYEKIYQYGCAFSRWS